MLTQPSILNSVKQSKFIYYIILKGKEDTKKTVEQWRVKKTCHFRPPANQAWGFPCSIAQPPILSGLHSLLQYALNTQQFLNLRYVGLDQNLFTWDMKHFAISVRWIASPNRARSPFLPHNFWTSYKHLVQYQSRHIMISSSNRWCLFGVHS